MIILAIAGGIAATLIILVAVGVLLSCWYSVPYDVWVRHERERRSRKRK